MIETPTRGAREFARTWTASPVRASAVRLSAVVIPILLGWLAVRLLSPRFWNSESTSAFIVQALLVAVVVAVSAERATRRFLPLAFLLDQSLVFPDEAPSRFGAALRANNLGRIDKRIDEIRSTHGDHSEQRAAVSALSLVAALSSHDRFTRGHTERVRAYADLIAIELGLSEAARSRLSWGVLLHDIGKLTVPEEILNKKTPLTEDEWDILRHHPMASAELLSPLSGWLGEWGRAAAEHHERWDGNGYPMGLAGKDISLAGRITAVADAYDVITSARSYKEPLSGEAARRELVRCAGEQFDPVVVRAMLQVSTGKRRNFGVWSWLTEVPTFARLLATAGSTSTGAAVAVAASVAGIAAPLLDSFPESDPPAAVAFVETTESSPASPPLTTEMLTRTPDDRPSVAPSDAARSTPSPVEAPSTTVASPSPTTLPPTSSAQRSDNTSAAPTTRPVATTSTTASSPTTITTSTSTTTTSTTTSTSTSTTTTSTSTTSTSTTSTSTTSTSTSTSTTTPPASMLVLYLKNPGSSMNTPSASTLPLELEQPFAPAVGNFDTDRNDDPGITLKKQGNGFGGADDTELQMWEYTLASGGTLSGPVEVDLYIAAKDFDTSKQLGLSARIVLCDPTCTTIASTTWSSSAQASWKKATLGFGSVSENFVAGARLQLRVIVPDSLADDDMMFAYDSTSQASVLRIG